MVTDGSYTFHDQQSVMYFLVYCVPGFFKNKVMMQGLKKRASLNFDFPPNRPLKLPAPTSFVFPNPLSVNEELDPKDLRQTPGTCSLALPSPLPPLQFLGRAPQFESTGEPRVVTDTEGKAPPSGKRSEEYRVVKWGSHSLGYLAGPWCWKKGCGYP